MQYVEMPSTKVRRGHRLLGDNIMHPQRGAASGKYKRESTMWTLTLWLGLALVAGCAMSPSKPDIAQLTQQVTTTERAFAKSMAERNFAVFTSFIADDAVFFSGAKPLRGKVQVTQTWQRYFTEPTAPFSWEPQQVEVLDSGKLAMSTGPVRDADGKPIGAFNSIWRQQASGVWRIVFDKGCQCTAQ